MDRKYKLGEITTFVLVTVAGALLLPVAAPTSIWRDGHVYADKYPWLSDIQSGNELASGLTPLVFVVVFAAPIRDISIFASGGGTVCASSTTFGDAGSAVSSAPKLMPTSTEIPILLPVEEDNRDTDPNNEIQDI
ncbi:hypothetical protein [Haloarcula sp. CBA1122]|uniref:hypothetical protein n=1 Tax=Haloarcula sp. CBA1122 TaxID=2668069 RepID=UPI0013065B48|nr:hypothetical protein [Haloarcula sp. CBA1122]MUV50699.1 hypothetical protein [Haloarcula sp. CBA1122]